MTCLCLTHCGLIGPYGVVGLGQFWIGEWLNLSVSWMDPINNDVTSWALWYVKAPATGMFVHQLIQVIATKTSNSLSLTLCEGNPPVTGGFPHKGPVIREMFPCYDVTMSGCSLATRRAVFPPCWPFTIMGWHTNMLKGRPWNLQICTTRTLSSEYINTLNKLGGNYVQSHGLDIRFIAWNAGSWTNTSDCKSGSS